MNRFYDELFRGFHGKQTILRARCKTMEEFIEKCHPKLNSKEIGGSCQVFPTRVSRRTEVI